jgi:hypothetical protein
MAIISYPKAPEFDPADLDKQNNWFKTYSINPIECGKLCEQFPGLQNAWNQFIITYQLCKSEGNE